MTTVTLCDMPVLELALPAGTEVTSGNDSYLIQEQLGRGGFGVIYRATLAGIDYALKIASGELAQKRLIREAEITAVLSRMNVGVFPLKILQDASITLPRSLTPNAQSRAGVPSSPHPLEHTDLAIGVIRDMSRLGVVLTDFLSQENSLSDAIGIMLTILRVLQPIHETPGLQYLHGDVSPENIIYVPHANTTVFIDFGSAQQIGQDGRAHIARSEFSYNPVFISPEIRAFIASRQETVSLSRASDIYSLGLILYGLLFEPPNGAHSEHAAILARNRINRNERSGVWSKAVCRLMMGLFEDCLAVNEDSRIQELAEFSSRLGEVRELLDNKDISKTSISGRLLERSTAHAPDSRFPISIVDAAGRPVDLVAELSDTSAHQPIFLAGVHGSGKTTCIRAAAHQLLDRARVIPIIIDSGELREALRVADMPRVLATAAYCNVFGHWDPPGPPAVTKLTAILGLCATSNAGADDNGTALVSDGAGQTDFILFIDNVDLLESNPDLAARLADVVRVTKRTRFVFCGNTPQPSHDGRDEGQGVEQAMRRGIWQDLQTLTSGWLSCSIEPLTTQEVQCCLRTDYNIECPPIYAKALSIPALLALLYEELAGTQQDAQPNAGLALGTLCRAFERFYRYGQDLCSEDAASLAYSQLTIRRQAAFDQPTDAELARWLLCEGIIHPASDETEGDGSSVSAEAGRWLFRSSLVGDFFASQFIVQTIRRATHVTHLSGINHVWHRELLSMLGALPAEELAALSSKAQRLIEDTSTAEAFRCDLIPSNMFALTGDDLWATLSVRLANSFFHEAVLDGYFTHEREIILVNDVEHERPVRYYLLKSHASTLRAQLPPRVLQALIADLRYGYRLAQDKELASRLMERR
jgi:serine/threonine protein kinase